MNIRVGFGYDVHQLDEGEEFWLGGIKLDHFKGAVGHSDADALLHAITDALLGAANMRDIGFHFPDTNPKYKDADSKVLLTNAWKLIAGKGWSLGNIDCTVCLEIPKVNPYIEAIQGVISSCLQCGIDQISIKATTSEKMGFVGKEKGVAVYAVALITKE